jgi:hypothetical protein
VDVHRGFAFDGDEHASFQHHMITDQLYKAWQKRAALLKSDPGRNAPRRGEARLEKNAPREPNQSKHI